ncbi:MAG: ABC transporter permease [Patescibacteria group bacterium]|nr:ABC transporter permease [Patescibacteria group bacterium]MDE2116301.1 ABC transporter permease [Patescibacteria group bacterium]
MFWTTTKRIVKAGFVSFWRNGFVSLSSVLIITVTLFFLGGIIFAGALLNTSLQQIKDKVDVNVYFVPTAQESDILALKSKLEALPEVASVQYVSSDQALQNFKDVHANDQVTLQALDELGTNPLGAILDIKAKDPSQYEGIAKFLDSESGSPGTFIDKINYYQNKTAIDTLTNIINGGTRIAIAVTLTLIIMSILIVFNTIRLAIYIAREEISVMRLVGASNRYVRGPFIVSGVMYGVVSALITLVLFYPSTFWVSRVSETFFSGFSVFSYYISNLAAISGLMIGLGAILGAVSSYLAVRKYLQA